MSKIFNNKRTFIYDRIIIGDNMEQDFNLNDTFILEYLEIENIGKVAHFFSIQDGHYFCRVIEKDNKVFYDRLSEAEEKEILDNENEYGGVSLNEN